jgi:hypothetical protein
VGERVPPGSAVLPRNPDLVVDRNIGFSRPPPLGTVDLTPSRNVSTRPQFNLVQPTPALTFRGSIDEGAVFGGLFLHLSLRLGLRVVVEALLESQALTSGNFRPWFKDKFPEHEETFDHVVRVWGL